MSNDQNTDPTKLDYRNGRWKEFSVHSDTEVRGFFGDYHFLRNFQFARVFLDGVEYTSAEVAYQAAKFPISERGFFQTCTRIQSVNYASEFAVLTEEWHNKKLRVLTDLLVHKFDRNINPELYHKLQATGNKYLEETNCWGDTFWGVHKTSVNDPGVGQNNHGKVLMLIRDRDK